MKLNQQLTEMSLKLSAVQSREKQLRAVSDSLNTKYKDLESTNQTLLSQMEQMSTMMKAQKQGEDECESAMKQGSTEEGEDELKQECKTLKQQVSCGHTIKMHMWTIRLCLSSVTFTPLE